jgi:hypothetical protein
MVKDSELSDLQQLQRALQAQDPQALNNYLLKRDADALGLFRRSMKDN